MSGNPRYSRWYSTAAEARARKSTTFTLDEVTRARLERLGAFHDVSKSIVVELLAADAEHLQFEATAPVEVPKKGPTARRAAAILRAGIARHCGAPSGPLQRDWCPACGAALVAARLLER